MTRVLLMWGFGRVSVSAARGAGAFGFVPKSWQIRDIAGAARGAGAFGFVPKSWQIRDIAGAARMVGLGMSVFVPVQEQPSRSLTDREEQVLRLIASGATNRRHPGCRRRRQGARGRAALGA